MMKKIVQLVLLILMISTAYAQNLIQPADTKFESYIYLLKNKKVAVFANNTSEINGRSLIDILQQKQINVVKVFSPEHGFGGNSDAGAKVGNSQIDGIPIISLYGSKTKPSSSDLAGVDIVIFDIQDVGVRYYTYISSLQRLMEALAESKIPLIILDRPNPNGYYIDGPVLESQYQSFVGMQKIPLVYGMTIGEYAQMLVGEKWLALPSKVKPNDLALTVITMDNYTHASKYAPPVRPSPNLPNLNAIYWYPSLGWFEGTKMSIGRGTNSQFQVLGSPLLTKTTFNFSPVSMSGATTPPLMNQICYGWNLQMNEDSARSLINGKIQLRYLIDSYQQYPDKAHFFTSFFDKLAGNSTLRQQIIAGSSESEIRASWQSKLEQFKQIRNKYLLYP